MLFQTCGLWKADSRRRITTKGFAFRDTASAFDIQVAFYDHAKGIRTMVRDSAEVIFVIVSLTNGIIFGRRVFEFEAAEKRS